MRFGTNDKWANILCFSMSVTFWPLWRDFVPFLNFQISYFLFSFCNFPRAQFWKKKKEKNRTSALLYHFQEGTSCRRKFGPLKNPHRLASALPFETILSFFLFFFAFVAVFGWSVLHIFGKNLCQTSQIVTAVIISLQRFPSYYLAEKPHTYKHTGLL